MKRIQNILIVIQKFFNIVKPEYSLTIIELRYVFFLLKTKNVLEYFDYSFNVIRNCSSLLHKLLLFFYLSLDQGIFPNDLKNARVTLIFKTGSEDKIDNYRPA